MDAPPVQVRTEPSRLDALGQRMRAARLALKLSQEALARPEFTKSYVSAVERGKVRPSLKALELLSRRLEVPLNELLAAVPPSVDEPDIDALEEDLEYQIATAKWLVSTNQAGEAVRVLNEAEQTFGPYLQEMNIRSRYGIYHQRAAAHVRLNEPANARADLSTAMELAAQIPNGAEDVERVRNLLGLVYYQQDTPHLALEHHRLGLDAIHNGVVKDINLRLVIYTNLANDYWALGESRQAIGIYQEALDILADTNYLERQSGIYWGLSLAYKAENDLDRAKLYAGRALDIFEAKDNLAATAQMSVNLAGIQIGRNEYDDAEKQLERARAILVGIDDGLMLSTLYETFANLELARTRQELAADYGRKALSSVEGIYNNSDETGNLLARANLRRTYARALRIAGITEHNLGNHARVDEVFKRAIEVMSEAEYDETMMEIELAYANLLAERGAHQDASSHYQAAFAYRNRRSMR